MKQHEFREIFAPAQRIYFAFWCGKRFLNLLLHCFAMVDSSQVSSVTRSPASEAPDSQIFESGLLTGLVGAGSLAVWFLLIDIVRGQPFYTPGLLASSVFDGGPADPLVITAKNVFAYSGVHVILFLLVGWSVALMFREFDDNPDFGIVYLLLYILFVVILFGVEIAVMPVAFGALGTWTVAIGNVLAAVAMFWFQVRRNPHSLGRLVEAWRT